jgi:muconolactone delta-isomerase
VLEGPETAVSDLVERLQRDTRHTELRVLLHRPIAHRRYGDWAMGLMYALEQADALDAMLTTLPTQQEVLEFIDGMAVASLMGPLT